ncbi:MAG: putative modification/repair radical protein [Verrucomicrobiaceae bacterium]|nr:putative modification/repair radical protein [Verrucomicrobiaceae bacterium]
MDALASFIESWSGGPLRLNLLLRVCQYFCHAVYNHSMAKTTLDKLIILADAAKYDASCASSGGARRDSRDQKGIGSSGGMGICHSYAPDGRCISLLKLLLTNWCTFDCLYCVNRQSSNVERARFTVEEVVNLTLDFYKRNVIEGLFLSSGIIQTPDYTMEQLIEVARQLREEDHFRGYIHLKTIPNASADLIARAGLHADRLSINVELPTEEALIRLAPEKDAAAIALSMERIRRQSDESREDQKAERKIKVMAGGKPKRKVAQFAPAGQSTQMIIGADDSSDRSILTKSAALYRNFRLRRVYYSAFSPIPHASAALPSVGAPLMREHRLYQADWLLRFYGFEEQELVTDNGMLSLAVDPKMAWALAHPEYFPVDINRAAKEMLLRVPGLGVQSVTRLLAARRVRRMRKADVERLGAPTQKVLAFVQLPDHRPAQDAAQRLLLPVPSARNTSPQQGDLFQASAP